MQNSTIIVVLVAVLVLGAGAFWYTTMGPGAAQVPATVNVNTGENTTNTDTTNTGTTSTTTTGGTTTGVGVDVGVSTVPMSATINYTANGFAPGAVTIKKGGTVTWVNQGGGSMWVAAASHPTHTSYDGSTLTQHCDGTSLESFDQCENGGIYSFTFDKVGKWNYHNHSRASHFGSVTVVE